MGMMNGRGYSQLCSYVCTHRRARFCKYFVLCSYSLGLVLFGVIVGAFIIISTDSTTPYTSTDVVERTRPFVKREKLQKGVVLVNENAYRNIHDVYLGGIGDGIDEPPPSTSHMGSYTSAAVAADHHACSDVGKNIMERQVGSAVDAAIASMLCVGVQNPQSVGIGGGSFVTIYDSIKKEAVSLDCREEAPAAAST
ncbi:unnamed protein product, partial [Owenia fusiformis]